MNQNYNNNEYEMMGTGGMDYQPRYPLTNAPGSEFQQMDYKDWMDMCTNESVGDVFGDTANAVRDGLIIGTGVAWALLGLIPVVGGPASAIAGLFNVLLPYWWPEQAGAPGTPQAQFSWNQLMTAAEEMVDKKILESKRGEATARWQGIQLLGRDYYSALCDWINDQDNAVKKERLRDAFDDLDDQLKLAMPFFSVQGFELPMLSMYAQAANMHLLLLRDVVQNGVSWGFAPYEVDRYYFDPSGQRSPGLLQLLGIYTNYCVEWYEKGLQEQYNTGRWDKFNNFRRNMTIMVLDTVAIWPTFDPRRYPLPTKSQLTRTLYTNPVGRGGYRENMDSLENDLVAPPQLFTWLREIEIPVGIVYLDDRAPLLCKQTLQRTLSSTTWSITQGEITTPVIDTLTLTIENPYYQDDVWKVNTHGISGGTDTVTGWTFNFIKSPDQTLMVNNNIHPGSVTDRWSGFPCRGNDSVICDPCDFENTCRKETPNTSVPCDDKQHYSHRLSYVGAQGGRRDVSTPFELIRFGYGWTHVSADNNVLDEKKITQIPAVKGYLTNGTVIKGPGSTGGNLVKLSENDDLNINVAVLPPSGSALVYGYNIRIRYASSAETRLLVEQVFDDNGPYIYNIPSTSSADSLTYQSFSYYDLSFHHIGPGIIETPTSSSLFFQNSGGGDIIIDKIEFIPRNTPGAEYEANQAVEKARKAVNALFTNDAKNALQLNVTDYAVDQAANLVECVSEEFHAQEKMILLDQVKFAKRLSQTRNLLNYGDFESSDWSGENGWRTSPHVQVASDNPIFKGRYLHMPGARSPQFSNNTYPTYAYQKVDESKLKSYTRYLVRGFVGNSKDLELLVERYGKDVHVEMDVPNDIRYTLPMNECGGLDRCKPASYQTRTPHTCTCKDTAVTHTDCQCKDKENRTSTNMYTNVPTGSEVYTNGFHAHKSCGCGDKHMDKNGTHPYKSCGCKDPHVFTYHIDTGCIDMEENVGLFFALKIASENGVANIDNVEIIEAHPLTGEALARVKKREQRWKQERDKKRLETDKAVQAAQKTIRGLFTNTQQNRLKFETLFPQIVDAEMLVQQIPYVYHDYLLGAIPLVPGMNYEIYQQLAASIGNAYALYEERNLLRNGAFRSGTGHWHVTEGVKVQRLQNSSVLVLSEWSHEASQQVRIDPDRGYVLRVTARKEGGGKGTVTMSDCAAYTETLTFTSCDYNTSGSQTMTSGTLSGFVTKTLEIFPDTDRIRIDIGETEGTFKVESVELICMELMEDHL
ncbi:insecticidal delta-endotoxin Cry8Ea1 family protein [Bacillus toyonensis]|uniref:insecticidal delta-endotoxin Cry8Ea1 family protein n=1 Tax=Bacillus toyonensis TaxID=155322 RepID=UPI000BF16203|nr:insecticidal delta-endotoxin Cry8Ea1 family protein [Bacillus toyonensis]PEK85374.1 hypothetical protein CN594_14045 [Bacillus toyonensis]PEO57871.1 hypothetical protein CN579_19950 [Bacillus toyonensis]PFY38481.1 hypothetical protein COL55_26210 [Bacillus toyonensis]PFY83056.1 hypothetical protein COL62_07335 [Bacillus toyonensis]PGD18267.1 hypothetical protein COM37_22135 [Bacillus toyonensis]